MVCYIVLYVSELFDCYAFVMQLHSFCIIFRKFVKMFVCIMLSCSVLMFCVTGYITVT